MIFFFINYYYYFFFLDVTTITLQRLNQSEPNFYRPRMWLGKGFTLVCLSVCLSVYLSVYPSDNF